MDYSQTVRLPKTDFPMRGDLPNREPAWVQGWLKDKTYEKLLQERAKALEFHLHDGPPFANGD
ncbi:MAG: class I tRNA ligase family protein, partial [Candidatus Methylacidiphilales bacterium]